MEWPKRKPSQLWGSFYFEPTAPYKPYLSTVENQFDFSMTPNQVRGLSRSGLACLMNEKDSTLPVTLICPWGRENGDYLLPPRPKTAPAPVCDFSGTAPALFREFWTAFRTKIQVDSYAGSWRNLEAPQPFKLPERLNHVGTYKFAIITDDKQERDWYESTLGASPSPLRADRTCAGLSQSSLKHY
jgi:hypothetical protein